MKSIFTWLTIFALGITLAACSAGTQTQLPTGGEDTLIKVGNPTLEGPDTPAKAKDVTKKLLSDSSNYKGSATAADGKTQLYQVQFNVETLTAKIYFAGRAVPSEVSFEINEDGSFSSTTVDYYPVTISGVLRDDSQKYPLDVILTDNKRELDATLFASDVTNFEFVLETSKVAELVEAAEYKVFDIDGDLSFDAQYYVASYIVAKNPTTGKLARFVDECMDSNTLDEKVALSEPKDGSYVADKEINCTCVEGACIDEPTDKVIPSQITLSPAILEFLASYNANTINPEIVTFIPRPNLNINTYKLPVDADDLKKDELESDKI